MCKGVAATGLGTPPVVTRELAEQCAPFVRTLVHNVRRRRWGQGWDGV